MGACRLPPPPPGVGQCRGGRVGEGCLVLRLTCSLRDSNSCPPDKAHFIKGLASWLRWTTVDLGRLLLGCLLSMQRMFPFLPPPIYCNINKSFFSVKCGYIGSNIRYCLRTLRGYAVALWRLKCTSILFGNYVEVYVYLVWKL
jgi:hypothetical protein